MGGISSGSGKMTFQIPLLGAHQPVHTPKLLADEYCFAGVFDFYLMPIFMYASNDSCDISRESIFDLIGLRRSSITPISLYEIIELVLKTTEDMHMITSHKIYVNIGKTRHRAVNHSHSQGAEKLTNGH